MVSSQLFLGTAATLIASSAAFVAPIAAPRSSTARVAASSTPKMTAGSDYAASLPGAPFGMAAEGKYFDPAGLATNQDPETIKKWREAELKHGRVSMLAAVGILVSEIFHPLFMGPAYIGPAVEHAQQIATVYPLFWVASVGMIAFIEGQTIKDAWGTVSPVTGVGNLKTEYYPGDLGFDPLGLAPKDGEDFRLIQSQELDLGRYAMIGVLGMIVQEVVDGQGILEHIVSRI
ncbi:unnamed protein product [Ectocarpus sp. 12 AP-2014]